MRAARELYFSVFLALKTLVTIVLSLNGSYTSKSSASYVQDKLITNTPRLKEPPPTGRATDVQLGIYINSFYAISEQTMDYSLNIYLRQQWTDPRLAYGKLLPDVTVKKIKMADKTWDKIWTPDVFFRNEKRASFHEVTTPNRLMSLHSDGKVWYVTKITATLSCPMKLHKYPLDTQVCPMMFESFGYTMDDIIYKWLPDGKAVQMDKQIEIPQFELVSHNLSDCSQNYTTVGYTMDTIVYRWLADPVQFDENIEIPQYRLVNFTLTDCSQNYTTGAYPCLQVDFTLKRDIGFYMIQMYIPSVLIVILSWVAFWISIDAIPARVTIGLLTVLTMTTQSTGARSQLPRVSYIKAIDVWMSVCLVFVFASLLEFAVVNVFSRKEIRKKSRATLRHKLGPPREEEIALDQINIVPHNGSDFRDIHTQRFYRDTEGRHRARYIDKLSRKLFPLAFLSFNIIYWLSYILG